MACGVCVQHWLDVLQTWPAVQHVPLQVFPEVHWQVLPTQVRPLVHEAQVYVPPQPSETSPHFPLHAVVFAVCVQHCPVPELQTSPDAQQVLFEPQRTPLVHAHVLPAQVSPLLQPPQSYVPPHPSETVPHFPLHAVVLTVCVQQAPVCAWQIVVPAGQQVPLHVWPLAQVVQVWVPRSHV